MCKYSKNNICSQIRAVPDPKSHVKLDKKRTVHINTAEIIKFRKKSNIKRCFFGRFSLLTSMCWTFALFTGARFKALYFSHHKASLNQLFKDALRWWTGHSGRSSLPWQLRRESSAHFYLPLRLQKRMLGDVIYSNNNKRARQTETDWIFYRSRER